MKIVSTISLMFLCMNWGAMQPQPGRDASNQESLDGTWIPVQEEVNGKLLPATAFKGQKLVIDDSTYTFTAESVDKGVFQFQGNKMDIYGREGVNSGRHFTAIYKLQERSSVKNKSQLTICYNLSGDHYPDAFETKTHQTYFLAVFERD